MIRSSQKTLKKAFDKLEDSFLIKSLSNTARLSIKWPLLNKPSLRIGSRKFWKKIISKQKILADMKKMDMLFYIQDKALNL